jgi:leucine dehydrogenase
VIAGETPYVGGLARSRGGSGDPSPATVIGVEAAIRTCVEHVFGSASLRGRSIGVLGLGHVGSRLAKRCARAGAKLVVTDLDPSRRRLARELGAHWVAPAAGIEAEVDVLSPCALGGVFDDQSVPRLRCRIIAGAANNQLADDRIADVLAARGILWAPDFVVNAGGIINIAEELGGYHPAAARRRVRGIVDTLRQIFEAAEAMGATPLTAAMELARRRLVELQPAGNS